MDLEAYLARIGHAGSRAPTRETLAAIVYRHTLSIPSRMWMPTSVGA
jgi:N-hydroxyarylamine O-acetyltransferase